MLLLLQNDEISLSLSKKESNLVAKYFSFLSKFANPSQERWECSFLPERERSALAKAFHSQLIPPSFATEPFQALPIGAAEHHTEQHSEFGKKKKNHQFSC